MTHRASRSPEAGPRPNVAQANQSPRVADGRREEPRLETGTTVVALRASDGAVLAADRKMSLGGRFTANKDVRKIDRVHPTAAMATSGAVGPAQDVVRSVRAAAGIYEARRGEPPSMTALSTLAGHHLRGRPVGALLAGVDGSGGHVYEVDGGGSVVADDYAATGSGMQVAYGVLEGRYDPEAALSSAREAAVDAVLAASERDTASGNGVTVARVTAAGVDVREAGPGTDPADDEATDGTDGEVGA